jgi:hypothetical protein
VVGFQRPTSDLHVEVVVGSAAVPAGRTRIREDRNGTVRDGQAFVGIPAIGNQSGITGEPGASNVVARR